MTRRIGSISSASTGPGQWDVERRGADGLGIVSLVYLISGCIPVHGNEIIAEDSKRFPLDTQFTRWRCSGICVPLNKRFFNLFFLPTYVIKKQKPKETFQKWKMFQSMYPFSW